MFYVHICLCMLFVIVMTVCCLRGE